MRAVQPRVPPLAVHESPVINHKSPVTTFPKMPKAPAIPFPRNVRRLWVTHYASYLPSRVPPILAAVSLSRLGR
jgi:hypothetical protein